VDYKDGVSDGIALGDTPVCYPFPEFPSYLQPKNFDGFRITGFTMNFKDGTSDFVKVPACTDEKLYMQPGAITKTVYECTPYPSCAPNKYWKPQSYWDAERKKAFSLDPCSSNYNPDKSDAEYSFVNGDFSSDGFIDGDSTYLSGDDIYFKPHLPSFLTDLSTIAIPEEISNLEDDYVSQETDEHMRDIVQNLCNEKSD